MTWHLKINLDHVRRAEFKEILKEEKAQYKGYKPPVVEEVFEPEYSTLETFIEYLLQEGETQYSAEQLEKLSRYLKKSSLKVSRELKTYGLSCKPRDNEKIIRGYRSVENKWKDCPSSACSGGNAIIGIAD